ncbi:MAG: signal peptidase II [Armatimonadetes bacterium]|nr:signal peptidase II [Armatimonadota bacterium]
MPALLLVLAAGTVFGLDAVSKAWALQNAPSFAARPLVPGLLSMLLAHNTGASFGLFAGQPLVVAVLALCVTCVVLLLWWLEGRHSFPASVSVGLILGGAAGNLWDRLLRGCVVDFLRFDFAPWWPVFNVADIATVIGVVGLGTWLLLGNTKKEAGR